MNEKENVMAMMAEDAAMREKRARRAHITARVAMVCLTVLLLFAMGCGTYLASVTICEQQWALNAQYATLSDMLYGAEIVTEVTEYYTDSGDGGNAVIMGDGNSEISFEGGETNGNSKQNNHQDRDDD